MGIFTRPDGIKKTAIDARAAVRRGSAFVETPYVKSYAASFHTGYDQLEPPSGAHAQLADRRRARSLLRMSKDPRMSRDPRVSKYPA